MFDMGFDDRYDKSNPKRNKLADRELDKETILKEQRETEKLYKQIAENSMKGARKKGDDIPLRNSLRDLRERDLFGWKAIKMQDEQLKQNQLALNISVMDSEKIKSSSGKNPKEPGFKRGFLKRNKIKQQELDRQLELERIAHLKQLELKELNTQATCKLRDLEFQVLSSASRELKQGFIFAITRYNGPMQDYELPQAYRKLLVSHYSNFMDSKFLNEIIEESAQYCRLERIHEDKPYPELVRHLNNELTEKLVEIVNIIKNSDEFDDPTVKAFISRMDGEYQTYLTDLEKSYSQLDLYGNGNVFFTEDPLDNNSEQFPQGPYLASTQNYKDCPQKEKIQLENDTNIIIKLDNQILKERISDLQKESKMSLKEISRQINHDIELILYHNHPIPKSSYDKLTELLKKGIPVISKTHKTQLDENFFKNIDSIEKAYFLGLFFADGSVSTCCKNRNSNYTATIILNKGQEILIDLLIKNIISSNKIYIDKNHHIVSADQSKYVGIKINSKKFVENLIKWGCVPKKSKIIRLPNLESEKLIISFLLGYYDGDGTKNTTRITSGSQHFLKDIKNYFKDKIPSDIKVEKEKVLKNDHSIAEREYYTLCLGPELFRKMMEISESNQNIPNKSNFSDKRQYVPLTIHERAIKAGENAKNKKINDIHKEFYLELKEKSDNDLLNEIWSGKTLVDIANDYHISDTTLSHECYKRRIPTPPSGYHSMNKENQDKLKFFFIETTHLLKTNPSKSFLIEDIIYYLKNKNLDVNKDFAQKWLNKVPLNKIIDKINDSYKIIQISKNIPLDIKYNLIEFFNNHRQAISITDLSKNYLKHKSNKLKPYIIELINENYIENIGTLKHPLYIAKKYLV